MQFDRALATTDDPTDPLTLENLSYRYLWNPAAVDQLMADEHVTDPDLPGDVFWPLADHLGTIRDLAAYDSATDTTSESSYSAAGEYGIGNPQVNGTVASEGADKARYDRTTDYVLDQDFGVWLADKDYRANSGEGYTEWSYSLPDSTPYQSTAYGKQVTGTRSEGETLHTSYEQLVAEYYDDGDWFYDLDESFKSTSAGSSFDASYSAEGDYSRNLAGNNIGTIEGTAWKEGESSSDTTYTSHSTLNANGKWNTPTISRTATETAEERLSYEGVGEYSRSVDGYYRPYEIDGTINESGHANQSIHFEATSALGANGVWTTRGTGSVLRDGESGYSYSASGDDSWDRTWFEEDWCCVGSLHSGSSTYYSDAEEDGSGKFSWDDSEHWSLTAGQWTAIGGRHLARGESDESLSFETGFDGECYVYCSCYGYTFEGPLHSHKTVTTNTHRQFSANGVDPESTTTSGQGTATLDSRTEFPNMLWQTISAADSWLMPAGGNNVREGSYLDELFEPEEDSYYSESNQAGFHSPTFCGAVNIGTPPMSGYSGSLSHSFDPYAPPGMMGMGGPGQMAMMDAPDGNGGMLSLAVPETSDGFSIFSAPLFAQPAGGSGFNPGTLNLGFATFDAAGRVASVANGNGSNTRFTYDSAGNLATVLDAVGNMTQWVYNAEGQVAEEINPLGDSRYYAYNPDGTLARHTDRNGRVRVYEYDDHQRVTAETWYANAADADTEVNPVNTIHLSYDAAGRITSEWDNLSSVSYVYTDDGLLAGTVQESLGGPTVVLAHAYSDAGLRTSTAATIDGVADYVDEYTYDSQGRLVAIAQYGAAGGSAVAAKEITLTYNDQGLLATVTRYTADNLVVQAQYTYDSAERLTTLVYSQGDTILASYAWAYGDDGASLLTSPFTIPTSFTWLPSGGLMPGQDTTAVVDALWEGTGTPASLITEITTLDGTASYSYDAAGQLLAATYTAGQTAEAYSYDANGNRITANGAAYLTGPNNQLLFDGVYSYLYDPEGNRTARFIDANANGLLDAGDTAATTYAWDHRNRLTRVTDYDTYGDPAVRAVDYLYDVENRWIGRDVDLDGDGIIDTRTRFAYDGNQIVMQFDRATASPGDPADPLTIDHLSHRYLWDPAAVDQLMADEHVTDPDLPGHVFWPLADHLGTIRDLAVYDSATDTTTIVNHRTFDAYGNLQSETNPAHDFLFAFTGRPLDQETSLQNNLHRWYDPAVGRWMSEDPIGFEGRDGNLARYVGNSPANATDPSGLVGWPNVDPELGARIPVYYQRVTPIAYETLLKHCNGDPAVEQELKTILDVWASTPHHFSPFRGGWCGTWWHNFLEALPPQFRYGNGILKISPGWFPQGSPSLLGGYAMVALGAVPGHYAVEVVFPDGFVVYLDNGWAGTGGMFVLSYDPTIPFPQKPLGDWNPQSPPFWRAPAY